MQRVTIKDLAAELGLSICTINKALTGKPRVSEETRERIVAAARRMGYRPNLLARTLVRPVMRLGVVYPDAWPSYFMELVDGARERLAELSDHRLEGEFHSVPSFTDGLEYLRFVRSALQNNPAGVILCLGDYPKEQRARLWKLLEDARVPFVLLGSGPEDKMPSLTRVWQDCRLCGSLAADLLGMANSGNKPLAVFIGRKTHLDHRLKIEGFESESGKPALVAETFDDLAQARPAAERLFQENPDIGGVYIGTENAAGVLQYLRDAGLAGKLGVVATGRSRVVGEAVNSGLAHATLQQRQREQGRIAVSELFKYLETGVRPAPEFLVRPSVLLRGNFDLG